MPILVKGIVFEDNCVWLRKNERGEWELPGGKIDEGEQPMETVKRELMEELGFQVEVEKIVHAWMYIIERSQDESKGVLVVSYLCELLNKNGQFETDGEMDFAQFQKFNIKEIENLNMPQFYKDAIKLATDRRD